MVTNLSEGAAVATHRHIVLPFYVSAPELFINIYKAYPLPALLLLPDSPHFTIAAVNTAYLKYTCTNEADITGKSIYDVFAGHQEFAASFDTDDLRRSLLTVIRMHLQHS